MENEYGAPPRYQLPSVPNLESKNSGEKIAEVLTSSPSALSGMLLRPNRLGPNGDVESGIAQEFTMTRAWASNWASQFKSPLGEFSTSLHLLTGAEVSQMLCNHAVNANLTVVMPSFFTSSRELS